MHKDRYSRVSKDFVKTMNELDLPSEPFAVLLGYSGGADSSTLLKLLYDNRDRFGYTLYALHVNHMIRGDEALRDENFCRSECESLGIPIYVRTVDVPKQAKLMKCGLEEAARKIRYDAFDEYSKKIASETGKQVLTATAHNADDNAETILFNLTRGSALSGLCGIKRQRDNVIRPLITSSKCDIIDYCDENGIQYITDSTNFDTAYTRNKLRHSVIPILREINPSLLRAFTRTSSHLSDDADYLNRACDDFIRDNVANGGVEVSLLCSLHPAISSRVVHKLASECGALDCSDTHVAAIMDLCRVGKPHSSIDLHGEVRAVIENGCLEFERTVKKHDPIFDEKPIPFEYGINIIPESGAVIARFNGNDKENIDKFKNIYKIFIQTHITSAKINSTLHLRRRRPGDVCNINGVNRKLKKLLWEIEPDSRMRDAIVLVCDDDGILWVPGARCRTGTYEKDIDASQVFFYVKPKDIPVSDDERNDTL